MRNRRQFRPFPAWKAFSRALLVVLGMLLNGEAHSQEGLRSIVSQSPASSETRNIAASVSQASRSGNLSFDGPWGSLQARELILEPPVPHVQPNPELQNWMKGTVWPFHYNATEVIRILELSGLDEASISTLTSPPFIKHGIGVTEIRPPDSVIEAMTPKTRRILYSYIGTNELRNYFQTPVRFLSGGFPRMAQTPTGLPEKIENLIVQLSYPKEGGGMYLTDLRYVFSQAEDDAQRMRIMRTISREASLHCWLDLPRSREFGDLVSYWSAGGRNPSAATVLNAVLENPNIEELELVHLLPPVPKKLLHTYAEPEQGVGTYLPDCHASAFSFFANSLPPRMLDSVTAVADERYVRATKPWQFGDVILIQGSDGKWVHACNYIAGEMVFTKNGQSLGRPWVMQTFNEVFASYLVNDRMQAFFFRLKPEYRE